MTDRYERKQNQFDKKIDKTYYEQWLESNKTRYEPTDEDMKCELQLQALSVVEPLKFQINDDKFINEIDQYNDQWFTLQPHRKFRLTVSGMEGDTPGSMTPPAEAREKLGRPVSEYDYNVPTELYHSLTSCHELFDYFGNICRSMVFRCDAGGWFPPHKDAPYLTRKSFRIAAFMGGAVDHEAYRWEMDGHVWPIKPGNVYYIDTRKTHTTQTMKNNSYHLVMDIPKTWENVLKLLSVTKYR